MKAESFSYALIASFVFISIFIGLLFLPKRKAKVSNEIKWVNKLFLIFEKQEMYRAEYETLQQFNQRIQPQLTATAANALAYIVKEYYQWKYATIEQKTPFDSLKARLHKHVVTVQSQFADK